MVRPQRLCRRGPKWLESRALLESGGRGRGAQGRRAYREVARERLTYGAEGPLLERWREGVALGAQEFLDTIRRLADGGERETAGRRALRARVRWEAIVGAVEEEKGESWEAIRARRGDWGVPMAMWFARRHGGLRLREIGERMGGMDYAAVSEQLRRFEKRRGEQGVRAPMLRIVKALNLET